MARAKEKSQEVRKYILSELKRLYELKHNMRVRKETSIRFTKKKS